MEIVKYKKYDDNLNLSFLTQTNDYNLKYKKIICRNCGKYGHLGKNCNQPVLSFGIIAFTLNLNKNDDNYISYDKIIEDLTVKKIENNHYKGEIRNKNGIIKNFITSSSPATSSFDEEQKKFTVKINMNSILYYDDYIRMIKFIYYQDKIKFLMVSRNHSIGFIEFMRGKYDVNDVDQLISLFEQMTIEEHYDLAERGLKSIIDEFINDTVSSNVPTKKYELNHFQESINKFNRLLNDKSLKYDLYFYLNNIHPKWIGQEYGFPKGRRNATEKNIECAKREFTEEAGVGSDQYTILNKLKPVNEVFYGTNNVRYKHTYYVALANPVELVNEKNGEIGNKGWYSYTEAIQLIRPYHVEKKNVLTNVYLYILNYLININ